MSNTLLHLHALEAHDFKRFEEIEINFESTLTVIRGPNGRGKSTILHAILFALFGVSAVPGGKAAVVRTGAKNAEVMLTFSVGDEKLVVRRTTNSASLDNIYGSVANGTSAVTDYILNLLSMSSAKDFNRFSYSAQGDTQALLTLGAPELGRIVSELSRADYIDRIVNRAKSKANAMAGELNGIGPIADIASIEKGIAETTANMDQLERSYDGCEREHSRLAPIADSARNLLESASQSNRAATENASRRAGLHAVIQRCKTGIQRALSVIDSLEQTDTSELTASIASTVERINRAITDRDTANRLRTEIPRITASMDAIASKVSGEDATQIRIDGCKSVIESETDKADQIGIKLSTLYAKIKQLKEEVKNGVCVSCSRPFENFDPVKHEGEISKAEKEVAKLLPVGNGHAMRIGAERTTLDGLYRILPTDSEKALLATNVEHLKQLNAALGAVVVISEDDLQLLIRQRDQMQTDERERAKLRTQLETARLAKEDDEKELAFSEKALAAVPEIAVVDTTELTGAYTEAMTQLNTARIAMDSAQAAFTKAEGYLEFQKGLLEQESKKKLRQAELEKRVHVFGLLVKYLVQNKARYLEDIWAGVMATVTQFTTAATDGRISNVARDQGGDFWFTEGDEARPIAAASGGQRSMMGIGMRLALGSLQPAGAGLLLLDEPSADLDDEWAATMAGALLAQDRQIVMVTHRAAEEYSATKTITLQ